MRITTVTSLSSPSPLLLLLAQLLLRLILPGQQAAGAASTCPTPCSCSNQASRVICTRRNLDEVPDHISNNTRYLNLQENSIQVNTHLTNHFPSCIVSASHVTVFYCMFFIDWNIECCVSANNFFSLYKCWGFEMLSQVFVWPTLSLEVCVYSKDELMANIQRTPALKALTKTALFKNKAW